MRFLSLVLLACGFALAIGMSAPGGNGKDDDMKRIQGTWVVDPATFAEVKDKETLKEVLKEIASMRFVFDGNTFTIKHPPGPQPFENGREEKSFFRLDPTKKPKQIDMSDTAQGIYEREWDTLELCWDQHAKTNGRPTKFSLRQEKASVHYFVLQREKKKVGRETPPIKQPENDAEKLFRQMETKIQNAKTLQGRFDATFTNTGVAGSIKGKTALGESDQVYFESDMHLGAENFKLSLVGTGAKLFVKRDGNPAFDRQDSPKGLGGYLRIGMARFGLSALHGDVPKKGQELANVNDVFKVSDFKLGAKEKVAGAEAQVVEYTVVLKGVVKGSAKMWINTQTNLPAKLEMRLIGNGLAHVQSETYTEYALDGKLDAKLFVEPK